MITESQKKEIQFLLGEHVKKHKNQSQAVKSLINVSESYVIQIKNGNFKSISDAMWINIGKQIGWSEHSNNWTVTPNTGTFKKMIEILTRAKKHSFCQAVAISPGRGKTEAIKWMVNHHENVFHIVCSRLMSNRDLLSAILRRMNQQPQGTAYQMLSKIVEVTLKKKEPIIFLDAWDKLRNEQQEFFISLYDELEGRCSIIIVGPPSLEFHITRKINRFKIGFEEIFSRIGRKFISLPDSSLKDVTEICRANGLNNEAEINSIYNECEGDLRRVKRGVQKALLKGLKIAA